MFEFLNDPEASAIFTGMNDEFTEFFGQPFYYIPQLASNPDAVLGEDPLRTFPEKYSLKGYITTYNSFISEEQYSKFGLLHIGDLEIRIARHTFLNVTGKKKPLIGDLIYIPWTVAGDDPCIFEITNIDHNDTFYHLGQVPLYKVYCKRKKWSHEPINAEQTAFQIVEDNKDFIADNEDILAEIQNYIE